MNTKSVNTVEWKKYTGKEEAREGGGGGGRWWQEAIRNSRQKQPTSKSLSNLIGVIESFRLHRHWADEVNTAMKSALTSPPPTPIMMCAITLALIGHSGLDEDKCLGLWWESIAPTGFHSISETKEMFINGMLDITGLESLIIFPTFCQLDHQSDISPMCCIQIL